MKKHYLSKAMRYINKYVNKNDSLWAATNPFVKGAIRNAYYEGEKVFVESDGFNGIKLNDNGFVVVHDDISTIEKDDCCVYITFKELIDQLKNGSYELIRFVTKYDSFDITLSYILEVIEQTAKLNVIYTGPVLTSINTNAYIAEELDEHVLISAVKKYGTDIKIVFDERNAKCYLPYLISYLSEKCIEENHSVNLIIISTSPSTEIPNAIDKALEKGLIDKDNHEILFL